MRPSLLGVLLSGRIPRPVRRSAQSSTRSAQGPPHQAPLPRRRRRSRSSLETVTSENLLPAQVGVPEQPGPDAGVVAVAVRRQREVELLEPAVQDGVVDGAQGEGPVVRVAGGEHALSGSTHRDAARRRAATGSSTCWSTWCRWTTSKERHLGSPRANRSATSKRRFSTPRPRACSSACATIVGGGVHSGRLPGRHQEGEVGGDGSRATAHVEQSLTGAQFGDEVCARILGGAPGVAAQHRLMVPVRVGHAYIVKRARIARDAFEAAVFDQLNPLSGDQLRSTWAFVSLSHWADLQISVAGRPKASRTHQNERTKVP